MWESYQASHGNRQRSQWWSTEVGFQVGLVAITLAIVVLDLYFSYISFAVLFSVPLVLLATRAARLHHIWWYVGLFIIAIYAIYFIKYRVVNQHELDSLFNFRLFNRTFAALTLALLGVGTQAWLYWQHERSLLTYLDKNDEDEVNATAGVVGCIGLGLLITAIDFVSPANFNLPILFAVPLYLVSWLHDRRSLWITAFTLVGLTWVGAFLTPPPTIKGVEMYTIANRIVVTVALFSMAMILNWHIARIKNAEATHVN